MRRLPMTTTPCPPALFLPQWQTVPRLYPSHDCFACCQRNLYPAVLYSAGTAYAYQTWKPPQDRSGLNIDDAFAVYCAAGYNNAEFSAAYPDCSLATMLAEWQSGRELVTEPIREAVHNEMSYRNGIDLHENVFDEMFLGPPTLDEHANHVFRHLVLEETTGTNAWGRGVVADYRFDGGKLA